MIKNAILIFLVGLFAVGCSTKRRTYNGPTFSVEGNVSYEKNETIGNSTIWSPFSTPNPVSNAKIAVLDTLDSFRVIVTSQTDFSGNFQVQVPLELKGKPLIIRAYTDSPFSNIPFQVSNHDRQFGSEPYFLDSEIFTDSELDMEIVARNNDRLAAAFGIYSIMWKGYQFVIDNAGENNFPGLRVHWEPGKDGNGCTCFSSGTFIFPHEINIIDLPNDRNEFDDSVLLHELGHYMHKAFSRNDSPGGPHTVSAVQNQNLDPRLSWSEGWATGFAQIVLNNKQYVDGGPFGGFSLNIEFPFPIHQGPNSELTIAAMYWDLYDAAQSEDADTIALSFTDIWTAMKAVNRINPNLKDFYQALLSNGKITQIEWDANFAILGLTSTSINSLP